MASSSSTKKYDVFISFRGEDTRRSFTSHLHSALCEASIDTYIDDSLVKGDSVWPALREAIENSRIAVVIFSKNYATSTWCLEELVKILESRKGGTLVVIPVFYEVDPSHVRKQKESYGEAFIKHGQSFSQEKVFEWKTALTEASSDQTYLDGTLRNESQLIEKIVKDVLEKLELISPYELEVKNLVEIDKKCEDVKLLLSKDPKTDLKKGRVIGIWGMGGIGKTTIAKAVFSDIFHQYDSVCFLRNVREESKRVGLISLHELLLSELLKDEKLKYNHVGSTCTPRRLRNKKVLIVLDDVDNVEQLDEMYREYEHAGSYSKLIITTRNRHLLSGIVDEDDIYEVKALSIDKSRELFILHAFKETLPEEGCEDLLERAIKYAGGVPLALKVWGSHLGRMRNIELWEEELNKLKNYPHDSIHRVLRVSYDGLPILEKKIFLDIAFYFKDWRKNYVERVLNACGFYATSGIKFLEDKALITISKKGRIKVHDLLQEMGLTIVREESGDPGKRNRLKDIKEVYDVLENKKGNDAIEGITLDLSEVDDIHLTADAFNMMPNLRFLIFYIRLRKSSGNMEYPRAFNKFPDNLRYLEWHGYRLKSLPPTFSAKMLVVIKMPYSHVTELWSGVKDVMNLEGISLKGCKKLKQLPDLSKASKLKWVDLSGCKSLLVIHPSILSLDTLETLILDNCTKLQSLKSEKHLQSLKEITFDGCTSLKEFSMSSDSLEYLDFSNAGIKELHSSLGRLSRLRSLKLDGSSVKRLPESIKHLEKLEFLSLNDCRLLQCLPELPPSIEELNAVNCSSLVTVSTLQTLAEIMKSDVVEAVCISFQNCKKLGGPSLHLIMDVIMTSSITGNADEERVVKVCLPGSRVPGKFTYRTTQSSITVNRLPSSDDLLGIVFCAVLSPSSEVNKHGVQIFCECYLADGTKLEDRTEWYHEATTSTDLNSNHVYLWFDARYSRHIASNYEHQQVSFQFYVTHDFSNISIKECGVHLRLKSELQQRATIIANERSDDNELDDINNQQGDLSENGLSSYGCLSLSDVLRCLRH